MKELAKPTESQENIKKQLEQWFNSNELIATLEGFAGTGKTFLIKYFAENLINNNKISKSDILVSAPTNTATNLIIEKSNLLGKTIHSVLGLLPNTNLENYDPFKVEFQPKKEKFISFKLWVIDEASMINKNLFKKILETSEEENIKVLFMGDRYQLPPIKEPISKIFLEADKIYRLNEIVRQEKDNPNNKLIKACIEDIKIKTKYSYEIAKNANNIIFEEDKIIKGFINVKKDSLKHLKLEANNFIEGKTKLFAFTNSYVSKFNKDFRNHILKLNSYISTQDSLLGYRAIFENKNNKPIIVNSRNYNINSITKAYSKKYNLNYFQVSLSDDYYNSFYVKIVDLSDNDSKMNYIEIINELFKEAKRYGKRFWINYYDFINRFLCIENIYNANNNLIKKKDLDFNYAMTVHKSQGSTVKNSFIALNNLTISDEFDKLMYVACSRATNINYFI